MTPNEEKEREAFEERDRELYGRNDIPPVYDLMDIPFIGKRYKSRYVQERFEQFCAGWKAGRAALRAESEPVLWQFYDDGKWFNCLNEQHRKNTEADGYEMRPLYTAPQTEPKDTGSEI